MLLGQRCYMAPEIARGHSESKDKVSFMMRADIFSLGMVTYELSSRTKETESYRYFISIGM